MSRQRPSRLRRDDLPELARAIVAVIRGRGQIGTNRAHHVSFVTITTDQGEWSVLASDWKKILPYIQSGAFSPTLTPVASGAKFLHPEVSHQESVELGDQPLYFNILAYLQLTFTEAYPTSDL